jgi:membrane-associated phospholipid phosphatase
VTRLSRALLTAFGLIVVVIVLARGAPASAQARRRPRTPVGATAIPAVALGASALAAGIALYVTPDPTPGSSATTWRGGILLDEGARDALRLRAPDARAFASTVSDALMVASILNAVAIDSLAVPLIQDDPDLAWQATAAYSLALGLTLALNDVVKEAVDRARPFERDCVSNPNGPGCSQADTFTSFYSGHTAVAFTSAGFSCAMHLSRSLYGDGGADAAACAGSLALAATTGLLRIVADRHYLSDVVVGALIGFAVGYVVPLIFVPERAAPAVPIERDIDDEGIAPPLPGPSVMVSPLYSPGPGGLFSPSMLGVQVTGTF